MSSVTVPRVGLSDHYPIFITRKVNASLPKSSHFTIKYRFFKNFNEEDFVHGLSSAPWDIIKVFEGPDDILETWSNVFLDIVNINLPIKEHRVKNKQQPKWLTPEIMDAMKTRDRWTETSEFGTYSLCEQRRFRRACASAQSRQNLRCSLIQAVSQEEPSDRKPDP